MTGGEWSLVDHACRFCAGRIVRQGPVYRCSCCGVKTHSRVEDICGCGIRVSLGKTKKPSGYRCGQNPRISQRNPAEIVIFLGDDVVDPDPV